MKLRDRIAGLLGISAHQGVPPKNGPAIDDPHVERLRSMFGGQITPLLTSQTRWYLADLETAIHAADVGDLQQVGRLWRAMRRDGVLSGILATCTRSIPSLPKKFVGDDEIVRVLQGRDGDRSVFDAMCPPAELVAMAQDGRGVGVSLGELVPVPSRGYPVLRRRDPETLRYRWAENRWYFQTLAGPIPIDPGLGRWVLHVEGAVEAPWQAGLWPALGASFIRKSHAQLHKSNWEAKLANPARAAFAPAGASQGERIGFLDRVIAWGINTVFELPPGWDVKIIESNGNGHESFDETIERSDREYMIALAGQVMTTDGGEGFSNGDIGENRLEAQIAATARALAFTINTQIIPPFVAERWGEDAIERSPTMSWDVTPPKDESESSKALGEFGKAIQAANLALAPYGRRVDALELASQYGLPLVEIEPGDAPGNDGAGAGEDEEDDGGEVIDMAAIRAAYGRTG